MTIPIDSTASISTVPAARANPFARVLVFLVGLVVLVVGAFLSFGTILLGAAAIAIATLVQRRRNRQLGRWGGWIAATGTVAAIFAIFAAITFALVPSKTWHDMKVSMDSARAASAKQPPPAWIERMYPGAAERAAARQGQLSISLTSGLMVGSVGIATTFLALLCGTIAWGAGMLLGFGVAGRWPGGHTGSNLVSEID